METTIAKAVLDIENSGRLWGELDKMTRSYAELTEYLKDKEVPATLQTQLNELAIIIRSIYPEYEFDILVRNILDIKKELEEKYKGSLKTKNDIPNVEFAEDFI